MEKNQVAKMRRALGAAIRFEREGNGWDQRQLAVKMGIHASAVSRIESGDRAVTFEEVIALAGAFDVLPGYFFARVASWVADNGRS